MANFWQRAISLAAAAIVLSGNPCQGQIMFENIQPGNLRPAQTELEPSHQTPIERGIEFSRPALPNDRPSENDRIHPTHLFLTPVTVPNIRFDDLRARSRITQSPVPKETIAFESIQPQAIDQTILGPRELTREVTPQRQPQADFEPQMDGFSKPTTRFDTSLYLLPRNPEETDRAAATRTDARGEAPPPARRTLDW